ncbi:AraC family transcriptional regulator [Chryseobacterium timonianum]|uniref:AraC family transcriptional regulator n=1 Tax=Chryseobacterium timonianum TaxID=1805473 RepID=UPI00083AF703|nr:AraC family transcriptional regulator [Chryseobacterium timonianum]
MENIKNIEFENVRAPYGCQILQLSHFFKILPRFQQYGKKERINFFIFIVVTKGKGKHYVDFKEYLLEEGSILFIAPGQIHQYEKEPQYEGQMLIFNQQFFSRQIEEFKLYQPSELNVSQDMLLIPDKVTFNQILTILAILNSEITSPFNFLKEKAIQKLIGIFLLYTQRKNKDEDNGNVYNNSSTPNLSQYLIFKQLLEKHFKQERSVAFYAANMAMTSKTLNRIIKYNIQKTAKEAIDERVIIEIKRLLLFEKMSIKQIAYELNFIEPSNLIKYFKKHTGQTPSSFKN